MSTSWKIDCYIISMTGWSGEELPDSDGECQPAFPHAYAIGAGEHRSDKKGLRTAMIRAVWTVSFIVTRLGSRFLLSSPSLFKVFGSNDLVAMECCHEPSIPV
ncbi:MAG TPA: hypothetical protein PLV27_00495 [Anaerolineaceae bacterium]|nr:hypothetical protein [Anaerolineaceae bacterium]